MDFNIPPPDPRFEEFKSILELGKSNAKELGVFSIDKDEPNYETHFDRIYFCHGRGVYLEGKVNYFKVPEHT